MIYFKSEIIFLEADLYTKCIIIMYIFITKQTIMIIITRKIQLFCQLRMTGSIERLVYNHRGWDRIITQVWTKDGSPPNWVKYHFREFASPQGAITIKAISISLLNILHHQPKQPAPSTAIACAIFTAIYSNFSKIIPHPPRCYPGQSFNGQFSTWLLLFSQAFTADNLPFPSHKLKCPIIVEYFIDRENANINGRMRLAQCEKPIFPRSLSTAICISISAMLILLNAYYVVMFQSTIALHMKATII